MQELHTKMGYSFVPHRLSREVEGAESVEFTDLLRLRKESVIQVKLEEKMKKDLQLILKYHFFIFVLKIFTILYSK